jgi:hypothetical protein
MAVVQVNGWPYLSLPVVRGRAGWDRLVMALFPTVPTVPTFSKSFRKELEKGRGQETGGQ